MATAFAISYSTYDLDKPILTALDSTGDSAAQHSPGYTVNSVDGRQWKYLQFSSGGVAAVAGGPAVWGATTANNGMTVAGDVSDSNAVGEGVAGVFCSILTDSYYGWIQTKGKVIVKLSSTCAVGSAVYATADSVFSTVTAQTGIAFATALEAGSVDASNCFVNAMIVDH